LKLMIITVAFYIRRPQGVDKWHIYLAHLYTCHMT
jgi:hypothetical protein